MKFKGLSSEATDPIYFLILAVITVPLHACTYRFLMSRVLYNVRFHKTVAPQLLTLDRYIMISTYAQMLYNLAKGE